jgi:uncharacterized membrane protein YphA (DoxX/SURF4 family)
MRAKILDVIAALFILLFVYAATVKLMDYQKFTVQLGQSPMLTDWALILGWLVPGIELLISILLVFERTRSKGLYGAFVLMVMFTAYIVIVTRFSSYVPCSCGGVIEKLSWSQHLIFNVVFIFLSVLGILLDDSVGVDTFDTT